MPDRPSARLLAATALYEAGRAEDAESWFRHVLEAQPANSAARIGLAEALLSQRRYAEAAAEAAAEPADSPLAGAADRGAGRSPLPSPGDHAAIDRIVSAGEAALPAHELAALRRLGRPRSAATPRRTWLPAAAGPVAGTVPRGAPAGRGGRRLRRAARRLRHDRRRPARAARVPRHDVPAARLPRSRGRRVDRGRPDRARRPGHDRPRAWSPWPRASPTTPAASPPRPSRSSRGTRPRPPSTSLLNSDFHKLPKFR